MERLVWRHEGGCRGGVCVSDHDCRGRASLRRRRAGRPDQGDPDPRQRRRHRRGQITHFPEPPGLHGSPFEIVAGADGNLWFNHTALLTPTGQAIGRITPSGEITEFRLGLYARSHPEELTSSGGRLWFIDRETGAIGTIKPPRKPPNTFLLLPAKKDLGRPGARLRAALPGPGRLTVSGPGIRTRSTISPGCGTFAIPLRPNRNMRHLLANVGSQQVTVRATFTPHDGSSFTQKTIAVLYGL